MEFLVIWLLFGIVSAIVASNKGRSGCGWFLLGFLLGPIGLILSLVVSKNKPVIEQQAIAAGAMKKCPFCAELVKYEAIKCRYCGERLDSPDQPSSGEETPASNNSVASPADDPSIPPAGQSMFSRYPSPTAIMFLILGMIVVITLYNLNKDRPGTKPPTEGVRTYTPPSPKQTEFATVDARDERGQMIGPINVWVDYYDRSKGTVTQVRHGDRVEVLQVSRTGVLIKTPDGSKGWVSTSFLSEYRDI